MEETFANNLVDSFKWSLSLEADIWDSQITSPHTERKKKKYGDLWRPNALITSDFKLIHIHKYQCLYKKNVLQERRNEPMFTKTKQDFYSCLKI